ncbi:MAG: RNA 2',3'-cyclic phosphodiesterase [Clostridia bacterium]|jgi:2'-5' RNA ligase|nr:RNA 2',3'-cyclic phosphodiesterase [Clostridia bacterium]
MRLFIAVNFSEDIKNKLAAVMGEVKKYSTAGNFTLKDNLHLTVVFIGETAKPELVKQSLDKLIAPAFHLKLNGLGAFSRGSWEIVWIGVKKNETLLSIYEQLSSALTANGFAIEKRTYKPHLTLGREVVLKPGCIIEAVAGELGPLNITAEVNSISLMKSERIAGKLVYTEIYSKNLIDL